MTLVDKIGVITTIVIFLLLAIAYFYAFRPKNKQKFEDLRNFVNDKD
ncbi:cbb3-type cytochrome c oxidase subunit 3 [Candidatus Ruthia endofausta]|uniref:Cbb3-type cytochrome c oxidase subunit 3 n=1 Tax=Candidatus Ruthia endofausta TaxID=2738852 RepID=A0A6N0HQF2_9GAMM|nr:cbb3-type cytochrome c oxidase subunit 3 [Candidatus Ruthia endofausta]QKQ24619.1 cbb3-type cytochrome c oxidase subunit 3 [Candidatus Ruthia endofausta]